MRTLSNLIQLRKQLMELIKKTKLKESFAEVNANNSNMSEGNKKAIDQMTRLRADLFYSDHDAEISLAMKCNAPLVSKNSFCLEPQ